MWSGGCCEAASRLRIWNNSLVLFLASLQMYSWSRFGCLFQISLAVSGSVAEQQLTPAGALPLAPSGWDRLEKSVCHCHSTDLVEELWVADVFKWVRKAWEEISKERILGFFAGWGGIGVYLNPITPLLHSFMCNLCLEMAVVCYSR